MDFRTDDRTLALMERARAFLDEHVVPAEPVLAQQYAAALDPFDVEPPIKEELRSKARAAGLWNLFLPDHDDGTRLGAGLSTLQYAPLAEITGHSIELAPEAFNCSPPDSGNMELLDRYGTDEQRARWLRPLLDREIRSCFAMTEPAVASSDPNNLQTTIRRDGDEYVVDGRKWWTTGILRPNTKLIILMGVSDPDAPVGQRHSLVLIPRDAPGVEIRRTLPVFGFAHHAYGGHGEVVFSQVRVPVANLLGPEGGGFAVAQARLGPGRIHHCMRLLGHAERAVQLMCRRAHERVTFGRPLAEQGVVQEWIADARIDIEQARLLVLKAAWLMDTEGAKAARVEISAAKVVVPKITARIVDRAIQAFGGAGVSDDLPLATFYAEARYLQIGDGPDEVHKRAVARRELAKHAG